MNTRQFFKHRYVHAPAKSATAEEIELRSQSGRARNSKFEPGGGKLVEGPTNRHSSMI